MLTYSYVTHEDICDAFGGDTLLAVMAPSGTQLEVPVPEMVDYMYLIWIDTVLKEFIACKKTQIYLSLHAFCVDLGPKWSEEVPGEPEKSLGSHPGDADKQRDESLQACGRLCPSNRWHLCHADSA